MVYQRHLHYYYVFSWFEKFRGGDATPFLVITSELFFLPFPLVGGVTVGEGIEKLDTKFVTDF